MSIVRDVWRRDQGAPFDDLAREQYAQARAKGDNIRTASTSAGIDYRTGMTFEKHVDMLARIRELRQGASNFVGVSVGFILSELRKNVELAREKGQLKSSNEALKLMYDIVKTDPNVANQVARQLPPGASTKSIKKQLLASLKQEAVDTEGEEDHAAE